MDRDIQTKAAQARAIAVFEERPGRALITNTGCATVKEGLVCAFTDGSHTIDIDMPVPIGGTGTAPSPGYFGRAAICSCIAIGIKMTAARENLSLTTIAVSIEQDVDNRGVLGMPGASVAPTDTRIAIEVTSPAPAERVADLIDRALQVDPWYLAFRHAQPAQVRLSTVSEVE